MYVQHYAPRIPSSSMELKLSDDDEREELKLAGRWLATCLAEHEQCKARQASNRAPPTRLIKITSSSHSIESICLLSRPESEPLVTAYLTLSHCWGGADIVKLKQENLWRFHNDIPLDLLPKSFSDAIRITVLLGYEFLWIDSLCIIQDSTEDWLQEAKAMGSVYRNSALTLAAVGGKDSHGGFFLASRKMPLVRRRWQGLREDMMLLETNERETFQPLHKRAWVLQEQCLSIRTLNFGDREISWDCLSMRASAQDTLQPHRYSISTRRCFEQVLEEKKAWTSYWWRMIEEYTSREVTYPTDRWEAIRGLAMEVEQTHGHKLLHGLWSHRLHCELLWTAEGWERQRLKIGAPSWSWLNMTGTVRLSGMGLGSHSNIVADVKTFEGNLHLAISACVAPICISRNKMSRAEGWCDFIFTGSEMTQSGGKCNMDTAEKFHDIFALQLHYQPQYGRVPAKCNGLLIVAEDERKTTWRRVGVFGADMTEHFNKVWDVLLV